MNRQQRWMQLDRMSKRGLARMLVDGVDGVDGKVHANAGPVHEVMKWSKLDIIKDILAAEYGTAS